MNGIVLSAGEGRRMLPITEMLPKPLLPIVNVPLIQWHITDMRNYGVQDIGINLYHQAPVLKDFLKGYQEVHAVVEPSLRGTGGGLLNFLSLFEDDVMIRSCDVIFDTVLSEMVDFHFQKKPAATLLLLKHDSDVQFEVDRDNTVIKIDQKRDGITRHKDENSYDYAGVSVFSSSAAALLPKNEVFSFVALLEGIMSQGGIIAGFPLEMKWFNINSCCEYWQIHNEILGKRVFIPGIDSQSTTYIDDTSTIKTKNLDGFVCIGSDCVIEKEVVLKNTIVLAGSHIKKGNFSNCILSEEFYIPINLKEGI